MSDLLDITEVLKKYKQEELEQYCKTQFAAFKRATERVRELEEKVRHLEELLSNSMPLIGENPVEKIIVSNEQALLEAQLKMMSEKGLYEPFDLEETKIMDLLLKNLALIKGKNTAIVGTAKPAKKLSTEDLIQIAASSTNVTT